MDDCESRWYVIKTARFKERYVQLQLNECAGAETYAPMVKIPQRYLRRGQAEIEPLFPGYIFARLDLTSQLFQLRRVRAFHSLVCFDGRPAWVDASIVEDLRRKERGRGFLNLQVDKNRFHHLESVRVVDGPFNGKSGVFLRYLDSAHRVCILLDILKPQAVIELPLHAVAPAPVHAA